MESRPTIGILHTDPALAKVVRRAVQSAVMGIQVLAESNTKALLSKVEPTALKGVFAQGPHAPSLIAALNAGGSTAPVCLFMPETDEVLLTTAIHEPRIAALMYSPAEIGPLDWELMYLSRRWAAPAEAAPHMGMLLNWGAATVKWSPRTTEDLRRIVTQIERLVLNVGVDRRTAEAVSVVAHELLMNAMYDAPVDARGQLRYALDRSAMITLEPHEVPELRLTIDSRRIALDAIDPFGRLPRARFFDGVLRGHRSLTAADPEQFLDKSFGGAGLGLHTLYTSGILLRAEVVPLKISHVSWMIDRTAGGRELREAQRSLYFVTHGPPR